MDENVVPIQLMSDLHLEFDFRKSDGDFAPGYDVFDIEPVAPILALLGDIGLTVHDELFAFLEKQLTKFERVLFVMGNHEGYGSSYEEARTRLNAFAAGVESLRVSNSNTPLGSFHFLDRTRFDLSPSVTVLGCTLWSHIPPESADIIGIGLNDFHRVENWNIRQFNKAHDTDVQWLAEEISRLEDEPNRRVVIFSHHAPTFEGTIDPRHEGSLTNFAFAVEMSSKKDIWKAPLVKTWAFGHTHYNCDFVKDGIRVISNQHGYFKGGAIKEGFQEDFILYV